MKSTPGCLLLELDLTKSPYHDAILLVFSPRPDEDEEEKNVHSNSGNIYGQVVQETSVVKDELKV